MKERIAGSGIIAIGEKGILVCGGNTGKEVLSSCYFLSPGECSIEGSMNFVRDELGVVIGRDGCVYAIGGHGWRLAEEGSEDARCLKSVERRREKGEWEEVKGMAIKRRAMGVVTLLDGVYAIGGFDGERYLSSVERMDEASGEWV